MPPCFLVCHKQLVYANTRHAAAFSAKRPRYGRSFHSMVMKGNFLLLRVLLVNHSAFSTANSRQLTSFVSLCGRAALLKGVRRTKEKDGTDFWKESRPSHFSG